MQLGIGTQRQLGAFGRWQTLFVAWFVVGHDGSGVLSCTICTWPGTNEVVQPVVNHLHNSDTALCIQEHLFNSVCVCQAKRGKQTWRLGG